MKPKVKSKPVPVKPKAKPVVSQVQKNKQLSTIEKMKAKLEREAAAEAQKQKIAALKAALAADTKIDSPVKDAPVGMLDGKGDEAGISAIAAVREFIQQQWSFSAYQAFGAPEAEVKLVYNQAGTMLHYTFVNKSGNDHFDQSLIRAIVKSKQLPQELPRAMEFEIVFNLKDMLDK